MQLPLLDALAHEDQTRSLDAVCLGRAGMDLYAIEHDTDLADVSGFEKHVGGSPALIAIGMAKLGARSALVSRVSDDVIGRFVRQRVSDFGVDVQSVALDATGTRTSLAVTEMRADGCAVVIYRNAAADLALEPDDVDEAQIAAARTLLVSGTALSAEPSRSAARRAIDAAVRHGTHVVLDLDYRAYTWASTNEARDVYARLAREAAILVGNREEFAVLGIPESATPDEVAAACLGGRTSLVFVKDGDAGSEVFSSNGHHFSQGVFDVAVTKPFGAGDAYLSTILASLVSGQSLEEAVRRGAASAAIVVAGTSCAEAMPDAQQLETFLASHG